MSSHHCGQPKFRSTASAPSFWQYGCEDITKTVQTPIRNCWNDIGTSCAHNAASSRIAGSLAANCTTKGWSSGDTLECSTLVQPKNVKNWKANQPANQLGSLHIHRMQNICSPHVGWTRNSHVCLRGTCLRHCVFNSYVEAEKIHDLWECDCNFVAWSEQTHVAPVWHDTEFGRWNRLEHVENIAVWCLAASKALCHQHFGVAQRATMSTHKLAERPITLLVTSMVEFFSPSSGDLATTCDESMQFWGMPLCVTMGAIANIGRDNSNGCAIATFNSAVSKTGPWPLPFLHWWYLQKTYILFTTDFFVVKKQKVPACKLQTRHSTNLYQRFPQKVEQVVFFHFFFVWNYWFGFSTFCAERISGYVHVFF